MSSITQDPAEGSAAPPRVSVVTAFFDTAEHLPECIESVLSQTFGDFEYILADNASRDGSLEIARRYAEMDSRIKVLHFDEHLPQLANYNRAIRHARGDADYFKFVAADDAIFPRCLEQMVEVADSDDEIGMVGCYSLPQNRVFLDGLDYYERVLPGREIIRRYLLDGPYIIGNPTTAMFRMAQVVARPEFFPTGSRIADTDVAMDILRESKFGFVHQVLAFIRKEDGSISAKLAFWQIDPLTRRLILEKYGRDALDEETFRRRQQQFRNRHYRVLGEGWLLRRPQGFWDLHLGSLDHAGISWSRLGIALGALIVAVRAVFNLEAVIRGAGTWFRRR